ncbi:hypothetical protein F4Z99_11525 [Candidatus Poribacteria bacterium]|nr:hypothetical protein [Candidatus Poribacteria bacterium]
MIEEARIVNGKVHVDRPNELERYVIECINGAVDRVEAYPPIKEDPLRYVIRTILGLDHPHDPEWQPYARYAKHNLADTETALKFIAEHYHDFKEVINDMAGNFGKEFYDHIFHKGFDLVRLTVNVYHEIVDQIALSLNMLDEERLDDKPEDE